MGMVSADTKATLKVGPASGQLARPPPPPPPPAPRRPVK